MVLGRRSWLVALSTAVLLTGCAIPSTAPPAPGDDSTGTPPENGDPHAAAQDLYAQHCAACHGEELQGGYGPRLRAIGDRLSYVEIVGVINYGVRSMPGGLVVPAEAELLAAWLSTLTSDAP